MANENLRDVSEDDKVGRLPEDIIQRQDPYTDRSNPSAPDVIPQAGATPVTAAQANLSNKPDQPNLTTPAGTKALSNDQFANAQIKDLQERKDILKTGADIESRGAANAATINNNAAELDRMRQEESRLHLDKAMKASEQRDTALRAQIHKASQERIDPEHYWNSKSTAGRIQAGIGIILGGFAAQKTGVNPALMQINRAIDEDINSQKHHIENSWKAISETHGIDNDAFNKELHKQTWENNYRVAALERVKTQLAGNAAATSSETVKNAANTGIHDLTMQQNMINNNKWKAQVAAQQAEVARMRGLMKSANDDVMKLVEKEGVTPAEAEYRVYNSPMFKDLLSTGRVPPSVSAEQKLHMQFNEEYVKLRKTGLTDVDAKKALDVDPRFQGLDLAHKSPIVPIQKGIEEPKDIEARTVTVQTADGPRRMQAANKEEASIYREKTAGAQQWEAGATKLEDMIKQVNSGKNLTGNQVQEWEQIRKDMIATYGVMKEGSKRLPNEAEAKRIEGMIGNPPNLGIGKALEPGSWGIETDMLSKVRGRISGLKRIATEARESANNLLTPTSNPPTGGASSKTETKSYSSSDLPSNKK